MEQVRKEALHSKHRARAHAIAAALVVRYVWERQLLAALLLWQDLTRFVERGGEGGWREGRKGEREREGGRKRGGEGGWDQSPLYL
jgi:hypothetical protein